MKANRPAAVLLMTAALSAVQTGAFAVAAAADEPPTVVELFTSQGCYSCPPAEAFLRDLAQEKSVLALEFHVDYWDDLVYGAAGKWKDVFSKREFTERQSGYNRRIRGRGNVYTPQMVIDGRIEAVGSQRLKVLSAIRGAEAARRRPGEGHVAVAVSLADSRAEPGSGATVSLGGGTGAAFAAPVDVWMVRLLRERETVVRAGENKGKTLVSRNIVTEIRHIGVWRGHDASFRVPGFSLGDREGCAVLVQDARQGPVLGAGACPAPAG